MRLTFPLVVSLSVVCLLACAACAARDNGGAVGTASRHSGGRKATADGALRALLPPALAARGALRVGFAADRAPLAFSVAAQPSAGQPSAGQPSTSVSGLEADLAAQIGRLLGVPVDPTIAAPNVLVNDVAAHRLDAAFPGAADRLAARRVGTAFIDFDDYLSGQSAVLVRQGNPAHIAGLAGLCGHLVGALTGSPAEASAQQHAAACPSGDPAARLFTDASHRDLMARLEDGRLEAVVDDSLVADYAAQDSVSPAELQVVGSPADPFTYGLVVADDNPTLAAAFRGALNALIGDGTYEQLLSRWGASNAGLGKATTNGA